MGAHQLFLSLGGNLGKKSENFAYTLQSVEARIGRLLQVSSIYRSAAWGFHSRFLFWNQVIMVETLLSPEEVLKEINMIENHFGRIRKKGKYLSRKMDIDILFYDDLIINKEDLTIPHALISQRKFILEPLSEIAPDYFHPVLKEKIGKIRLNCVDSSKVTKIESSG